MSKRSRTAGGSGHSNDQLINFETLSHKFRIFLEGLFFVSLSVLGLSPSHSPLRLPVKFSPPLALSPLQAFGEFGAFLCYR